MAKTQYEFSIIIPAYKEESVIGTTLDELAEYLSAKKIHNSTEVIVVSAGNADNTATIAMSKKGLFDKLTIIEPTVKIGKGRDVREGMLSASGKYIVFMDADLATPLHHLEKMFRLLQGGSSVVIGIRRLTKIHNSHSRRVVSIITNKLVRLLAVRGVSDTQCGFKGFSAESTRLLFGSLDTLGWGFDMEILARAQAAKLHIDQIAIDDWHDPKDLGGLVGESPLKAMSRTLSELIKIGSKRITGSYKVKK